MIRFIINLFKRKKDIKQFKQQQLTKSFNRNKLND